MTTRTRPAPRHGTRACYLRGCRRAECSAAHYHYMSRYRLHRHRHGTRRTSATPARTRARTLRDAGWQQADIARAAHCSSTQIRTLVAGKYRTIHTDIARRILAVPVGPPPTTRYVDATGTARRLRALLAIGYNLVAIADTTGINKTPLGAIARGDRTRVEQHTAQAVAGVYAAWRWTPGPSVRARNHAARRGWHSPLAWDDIDNPAEKPDTGAALELSTQPKRSAIRNEEIRHLAAFGIPEHEIARRVGLAVRDVHDRLAKWRHEQMGRAA